MPRHSKQKQIKLKARFVLLLARGLHRKSDLARSLGVSYNTVSAWLKEHHSNQQVLAGEAYEDVVVCFKRLYDKLEDLQVEAWSALSAAKNAGDYARVPSIISTINGLIRTQADMLGLKHKDIFALIREKENTDRYRKNENYIDLKAYMKKHNVTASEVLAPSLPPSLIRPRRQKEEYA